MNWNPPPPPKSLLGRHRVLSPTAGIKVSPLCLGAMNLGTAWTDWLGRVEKENAFELLDYFYEQGGNFIDTANAYQDEQSELWIGEWMAKHNVRDQMVIATKYTSNYQRYQGDGKGIYSNFGGNNLKSLRLSVDASLKKLQTSYIDVLYVHWYDFTVSVEEIMQGLNDLVQAGKVLYLGASDLPAWFVAKANQYARDHGLRQFVVYQGQWSAAQRDFEREILGMAQHEGLALAPWGALGGGNFKTKQQREAKDGRNIPGTFTPRVESISSALEKIAERKNTIITSVALAYVMAKAPYVFPIVGGRKVEHLKGNIEALSLELTPEDIDEIEGAAEFDVGFPLTVLGIGKPKGAREPSDNTLMNMSGRFDYVQRAQPIKPKKLDDLSTN